MENLKKFFKTNKSVVVWTVFYFLTVYFILFLIFGFNMLSAYHWTMVLRARLHGFAGFAFIILILSAVPLYIATTSVIIKTKKPLFSFAKEKPKTEEKKEEEKKEVIEEVKLRPEIPNELRGAFLRAKQNLSNRQTSAFEMQDSHTKIDNEKHFLEHEKKSEETLLPIPDDFNFDITDKKDDNITNTPVFKEINFDTENKIDTEKSELIKHLESNGFELKYYNDITITNKHAIAVHDDKDFWIADEDTWFAAGKQKKSPIALALAAAEKFNVSPALYLEHENIMDLENKISEWESSGIKVVKDKKDFN